MNPNNRRVIAMTIQGKFSDRRYELHSMSDGKARPPEQLVTVPMSVVRYLTRTSGFLSINSNETDRFIDFDSGSFRSPNVDWVPPYPYCPNDVLFPVERRELEYQILEQLPRSAFLVAWEAQALSEQLLANDSLGG